MKKPDKPKKPMSAKMRAHIKRLQLLNSKRKNAKAKTAARTKITTKLKKVVQKVKATRKKAVRKLTDKQIDRMEGRAESPEAVIAQAGSGPAAIVVPEGSTVVSHTMSVGNISETTTKVEPSAPPVTPTTVPQPGQLPLGGEELL